MTANLANFAYDPINYDYLKKANAFELLLELLGHVNPVLVNHGITGLCNFCLGESSFSVKKEQYLTLPIHFFLDPEVKVQLSDPNKLDYVLQILKSDTDPNIACNCVTILIYLLSSEVKVAIVNQKVPDILEEYKSSSDPRLKNLSTILLEDLNKLEQR